MWKTDANVVIEGFRNARSPREDRRAGCIIKNSVIGDDCEISPYSVVKMRIWKRPVHRSVCCLRPGAELLAGAYVGNFC